MIGEIIGFWFLISLMTIMGFAVGDPELKSPTPSIAQMIIILIALLPMVLLFGIMFIPATIINYIWKILGKIGQIKED